jgi:hypothetical protein
MRAGRQFSSFCSKVQLLSVRFVIILILSLFVIYQKVIFRDGQQLEKFANKYELALKYEQDTLSDVDPPFKQILFWNDVRHFSIIKVHLFQIFR